MNIEEISSLANKYGWRLKDNQEKNYLIIFVREDQQINVWWTNMTVGTTIPHPKYKSRRVQMFRKGVSREELVSIFNRPRTHTGKGYFQKNGKSPEKSTSLNHQKSALLNDYNQPIIKEKTLRQAWDEFFKIFCKEAGIEKLAKGLSKFLVKVENKERR